MTTIIGIDPGIQGAYAFWDGYCMRVWDTPTKGHPKHLGQRVYDIDGMRLLYERSAYGSFPFIEAVSHRPGEGTASIKKMGYGEGLWHGILRDPVVVQAVVWKRALGLIGADKEASRALAMVLYPGLEPQLKRKKDHNRADAILICHYGRWVMAHA